MRFANRYVTFGWPNFAGWHVPAKKRNYETAIPTIPRHKWVNRKLSKIIELKTKWACIMSKQLAGRNSICRNSAFNPSGPFWQAFHTYSTAQATNSSILLRPHRQSCRLSELGVNIMPIHSLHLSRRLSVHWTVWSLVYTPSAHQFPRSFIYQPYRRTVWG